MVKFTFRKEMSKIWQCYDSLNRWGECMEKMDSDRKYSIDVKLN